ncbi:hypothetical protein PPL_11647 [Heterostelium album PN500]|uniref:Uncharacterized protein n=1 Tax=Heterostelium pallidum (strain ATCC 26659 / Pp 5 / PN500) TaxID=670386 RepID=D3BVC1_HETP5|nr:hypothetical protein PPL_11647 [Heterostelium album PN500]EFA74678.1 hypothetical protein PPL_11647 [Heterostelium album PN500]|eukprot:XP_020426812.1 hypothetical protein PPL_11647 [Heterostelium album PN500]
MNNNDSTTSATAATTTSSSISPVTPNHHQALSNYAQPILPHPLQQQQKQLIKSASENSTIHQSSSS